MATASGRSSAMYSFKASRRSATAGRPKCRSEICVRVATNSDSTRTHHGSKPSPSPPPARQDLYLPDALQEIREDSVELLGGFEVREVAGPGNGHVAGVGYLRGHGTHDLGGKDAILLPADDQGRDADLPEERGRVRAIPHGAEGGDDAVGRVLEDHGPYVLHKF